MRLSRLFVVIFVVVSVVVSGPVAGQSEFEATTGEAPKPVAADGSRAVLFDQPNSGGTSGIVSDFYIDTGVGTYSADDFVLTGTPGDSIELIVAEGFCNSCELDPSAVWIGFRIYPDAAGIPAGQPEDGGGTEVWGHVANIGDPGLDVTGDTITLDLIAAGLGAVYLPAGTYWLTVYPAIDVAAIDRWNWYNGVDQGFEAHLIDNGNFGGLPWTSLSALGVTFSNLAFRIEGTANVPVELQSLSVE